MSTRHVLLGLLREQPSHTYDVVVRFGRRLHPWQINRGQVYRMVSTLEAEGLIEEAAKQCENARSGPTWKLTAAGLRELDRWFATRSEDVEPLRGELLAKLAVAEPRHAPELLAALDWYERALTSQLEVEVHERQASAATEGWLDQVAECLAHGAILHRNAELTWVRRVREFVQGWMKQESEVDRRASPRYARVR